MRRVLFCLCGVLLVGCATTSFPEDVIEVRSDTPSADDQRALSTLGLQVRIGTEPPPCPPEPTLPFPRLNAGQTEPQGLFVVAQLR